MKRLSALPFAVVALLFQSACATQPPLRASLARATPGELVVIGRPEARERLDDFQLASVNADAPPALATSRLGVETALLVPEGPVHFYFQQSAYVAGTQIDNWFASEGATLIANAAFNAANPS